MILLTLERKKKKNVFWLKWIDNFNLKSSWSVTCIWMLLSFQLYITSAFLIAFLWMILLEAFPCFIDAVFSQIFFFPCFIFQVITYTRKGKSFPTARGTT